MAVTNAAVSFRTVEQIKTEAFEVISQYGLTPSQVFNMFLTQIAKTKSIPVDLSYLSPNAQTLSALDELESGKAAHFYVNDDFSAEDFTQAVLCAEKEGIYNAERSK